MDARDTERLVEAFRRRNIPDHNHIIVGSPLGEEEVEFFAIELGLAEVPDALKVTRVLNALSQANLLHREEEDRLTMATRHGDRPAQYTYEIYSRYILLRDVHYDPDIQTG